MTKWDLSRDVRKTDLIFRNQYNPPHEQSKETLHGHIN